ncbi:MAG: hypothetical protein ABR520_07110, partial [Mycobacteriales bacterium]
MTTKLRYLAVPLIAGLIAGVAPSAHAADIAAVRRAADVGAGYLATQVSAQGFIAKPASTGGGPDYSGTAYAVLAFAAAQVGYSDAVAATNYLAAHIDAMVGTGAATDPGSVALLILVAHAMGRDPRNF